MSSEQTWDEMHEDCRTIEAAKDDYIERLRTALGDADKALRLVHNHQSMMGQCGLCLNTADNGRKAIATALGAPS